MPLNETQRYFYQDLVTIWRQVPLAPNPSGVIAGSRWTLMAANVSCDHQPASLRVMPDPSLGQLPQVNPDLLDKFHFDYGQDIQVEDILVKRTSGARDYNRGYRVVSTPAARQSPEANYVHVRVTPVILPLAIPVLP